MKQLQYLRQIISVVIRTLSSLHDKIMISISGFYKAFSNALLACPRALHRVLFPQRPIVFKGHNLNRSSRMTKKKYPSYFEQTSHLDKMVFTMLNARH